MKTTSVLGLIAIVLHVLSPLSVAQQPSPTGRIQSMSPLVEKSELHAALVKFKGTQVFQEELQKQGRLMAFELASVLTFTDVPGQTILLPVIDAKTRKLVGVYYVYSKDGEKERSAVVENVDKESTVLLGEPGRPRAVKFFFDANGRFKGAETVGSEPKFWTCVVDVMKNVPGFAGSFSGAVCTACLKEPLVTPCVACGAVFSGFVVYSLVKCR